MTKTPPATPLPRCPGIIRGTRHSDHHATVTIDGRPLDWKASLALCNHSPTGIEWGYLGSGPAQLALPLLLQIADEATALRFYQHFKDGVIARITALNWLKLSRDRTDVVCMDVETDPDPGP